MIEAYVGADVGTASARAGVFDASGRLLASARRPIQIFREAGEVVEHSSADIWAATCAAVLEAARHAGAEIRGIGFDATCSLVALDANGGSLTVSPTGRPERDTIVWMDHRAVTEAAEINAGGHEPLRFVGGVISPEMEPPKLMWLARHAPDTFARAQFFDLTDFLTFKASGSAARSTCTVVCKWLYQGLERRWPEETYKAVGLGPLLENNAERIGAEIVAPGAPLGRGLLPEAAAAMGLSAGIPVGAGLIDAHAGALGTIGGALAGESEVDPGKRLALILGTSSCCMAISPEARFIPGVWGPHFNGLLPGQWLTEGGQSAFGAAIDRLLRMHSAFAGRSFEALERNILARCGSASRAAELARDLHVLPDFLGNRSPFADPRVRGAIAGLDLDEDEESLQALYVAGLCGLSQGLAQVMRALEAGGYAFDALVVSGGAARGALVRQIVADVCGRRVVSAETEEPVLLGAAMLGAVAAGRYDLPGAMRAMSRLSQITPPANGAIAALHARKRRAFEILQRAEREIRATAAGEWPALLIFDCDGVLVDSETISLGLSRTMLAELGFGLTESEARDLLLGVSAASARKRAEARFGVRLPESFEADFAREVLARFALELTGVPGVRETIAELGLPVCVASSSSPERIRASLRIVGYADLFGDHVFSAHEVANGKPAPDLPLHAAEQLGAPPAACLVIEDSVAGVTAARRAGMTVFGFVGGAHHQGGDYASALTEAGAALVFDNMRHLPELVRAARARRSR